MITPATPRHARDFEIHYFTPEKPQWGFLARISNAFSSTPIHRIALPDYPDEFSYGSSPSPKGWSAVKRFRAFLLLVTAVFIALHLFILPSGENGLFDVLQGHRAEQTHGSALVWEGWVEPPAPIRSTVTPSLLDDILPTSIFTPAEAES